LADIVVQVDIAKLHVDVIIRRGWEIVMSQHIYYVAVILSTNFIQGTQFVSQVFVPKL